MIDDSFDIKLSSGQPARLIPSISDTKKEERVTSVLLAAFRVVPAFALEVLQDAGAPSGKVLVLNVLLKWSSRRLMVSYLGLMV